MIYLVDLVVSHPNLYYLEIKKSIKMSSATIKCPKLESLVLADNQNLATLTIECPKLKYLSMWQEEG